MVRRSTIAAIAKSVNAPAMAALQRALRETRERAERNKAEEGLRRSEMYLAEGATIDDVRWTRQVYSSSRSLSQSDPKNFVLLGAASDVTERKRAEQERQILRQLGESSRASTA
jgi:PAS domain-containing protein